MQSNSLHYEQPLCQQSANMSLFVSDSRVVAAEQRTTSTSKPMKHLLHFSVTCLRYDIHIKLLTTCIPNAV